MVPLGSLTPVISLFPHKRQCQQADALFTPTHNEGQCEGIVLWSLCREATVWTPHVPHRHTQTCATHTYTHANIKVHRTQSVYMHARGRWHKASSAQLRLCLMWAWPSRQKRSFPSITHTQPLISVCFCVYLSSRLSLSVSVSLPVSFPIYLSFTYFSLTTCLSFCLIPQSPSVSYGF